MSFEKIDVSLEQITQLVSNSTDPINDELSSQIINGCIAVFDQLFADGLENNSIEARIENLINEKTSETELEAQELTFEYIKRIITLKDHLDSLPDNFPSKEKLNARLLGHCSSDWMRTFRAGTAANAAENFSLFRKEYFKDFNESTVEVRTWGTKEELGNGLNNVLRQKLQGDNVGHVAIMMRFPVNQHNKALIENYCYHENGKQKIPVSIERSGTGLVYKVYWSYWPGRLSTPNKDIKEERTGFEFKTQSDVLSRMPPELKERHIFQKQKKDFFERQQTINLAPVATTVISEQKYSTMQQEYLSLKLKKYKIDEEIQTLATLMKNYLNEGKEFSAKGDWTEKSIKPSSNLLSILARFKNEIGDRKLCANILKNKKITKEQAELITRKVDKLLDDKFKEVVTLNTQIKEVMQEIYAPAVEIKNIKKEIKEIHQELKRHTKYNDLYKEIEAYKQQEGTKRPPMTILRDWCDAIDTPTENRLKLFNGPFTHEKIDELLAEIKKKQNVPPTQEVLLEKLHKANQSLNALLISPKKETIRIHEEKLKKKTEQIKTIEEKIVELQTQIKKIELNQTNAILLGNAKIAELEQMHLKFEKDKTVSLEPINKKISTLKTLSLKIEADQAQAIANTDHKLEKLERLLAHFDTISDNHNVSTKGIKFNYKNNRERSESEKELFGNSPNYWRVKNKEAVVALINIVKEDRNNLQLGKLPKPINFVYTRDKTEEEIERFGNNWYPKTGEDIWKLSNKEDVDTLLKILDDDRAKAAKEFKFQPVDFSYGSTRDRPKTPEEQSAYGALVYDSSGTHHWAIKSQEDLDKLIEIIKADQAKLRDNPISKPINFKYGTPELHKRTEEEKNAFGSNRYKTGEFNWAIKDIAHAQRMIEIMQSDIGRLQEESRIIAKKIENIRLQSRVHQVSKDQIIRGIPTRNAVLHDFNIEEMLKTASQLASTTSAFDLIEENCSTTSMKLLRAGAPPDMSHMFTWTQNTADNPASNAFLTNPQAVYSAATLVAKSQGGDKDAIDRVKAEALIKPNTNYYLKINRLLAFKDNKTQLLNTLKSNVFSYLRIVPQLISDLWVTTDTKHAPKDEQEIDKYLNKINDAVRAQGHSTIKHEHPLLAIQSMKEKLQEAPDNIPFFDEKTLKTVREYFLNLESKEPQTEEEIQLLKDYSDIINERDERLSCVELAVMRTNDPAAHLLSRTDKSKDLKWAQAPSQQAEIMLAKFIEEYSSIQSSKYFQFMRSNFIGTLPSAATAEERLQIIQKHILETPSSTSARAWDNCKFTKETLDLVGIKSDVTAPESSNSVLIKPNDPAATAASLRDRYRLMKEESVSPVTEHKIQP
ncbi:hypothetical protein [Legionella bononiensis]|uniref:Uncharacterized protein n=1 Tax=Legionella bononiensis TaxID=2793102 RepID=A0ABS1WD86_9GAMM|nr:hypothetical protein [Legionella bononiensis]MBL7479136.1 hypothetical protein [Legionella bononiensis]MBL7527269.1 hypothetical protein [Legionella bononiensis]MBL7562238.1 hypothetical protein [Legionella bononiensis]